MMILSRHNHMNANSHPESNDRNIITWENQILQNVYHPKTICVGLTLARITVHGIPHYYLHLCVVCQ